MKIPKKFQDFVYKLIIGASIFFLALKTKVEGIENLPKKGGFIIVANHPSSLDPLAIVVAMRRFVWKYYIKKKKKIYGFGDEKLKKRWYSFYLNENLGYIPSTKKGTRRAVELLNQGNIVEIFPEGIRNARDYIINGKKGVAFMAMLSKKEVPVIPVGSISAPTFSFFQGVKALFKSRKVIFGSPMYFQKRNLPYLTCNSWLTRKVTNQIMRRIAQLVEKEYEPDYKRKINKK